MAHTHPNKHLHQKLSDQVPVDFDYSLLFVASDDIVAGAVSVDCPAGVSEVALHRAVTGQMVQCRFDLSAATVGETYTVTVWATTTGGDTKGLDLDIYAEAD